MTSKSFFSRATVKGAAAALVVAAGAAGATFAVAQQDSGAGVVVGGVTYTVDSVNSVEELKDALKTATNKADVVKLLNLAAQAGLTKGSVLLAIQGAKQETSSTSTASVLGQVELAVTNSTAGGDTVLSFVDAPSNGATGAVGGGTGNNAASGSPIETANNDGGTGQTTQTGTTTTVVYVG